MPESTSSNTMVSASPTLARQTLSASRKRDSSPPEATRAIGAGGVPGLVATMNCTRSVPGLRPVGLGQARASSVTNLAFSSLSGPSSAATALSSRAAPLRRAVACACGRGDVGSRAPPWPPPPDASAPPRRRRARRAARRNFSASAASSATATLCLRATARSANRRSSIFSSRAGSNSSASRAASSWACASVASLSARSSAASAVSRRPAALSATALDQAMRRAQARRRRRVRAPARPAPGRTASPMRAAGAQQLALLGQRLLVVGPWAQASRAPSPRGAGNPRRAAPRPPRPRLR